MSDAELIRSLQNQMATLAATLAKVTGERRMPTFAEVASPYLADKLTNPTLRAATKRSFNNSVRLHLLPAFGSMTLDKLTNVEWLKWVESERAKPGRHLTRFFNTRKALIEILRAAKDVGHIEKLPKLDDPDESKQTGRTLDRAEVIRILWKCSHKFRVIFQAFFRMGCRPREILRWEWNMIRWNEPEKTWIDIPARISKTGRARSIPINPRLSYLLAIRHRRGNGSPFVFPARGDLRRPQLTYQSAWTTACGHAGITTHAVPYDFRRTFITERAAAGKPMLYVTKQLDTSIKMAENTYAKAAVATMEDIIK
jgi:integrase